MPRKPMTGPALGALLQDLSLGALLRVVPPDLVQEALEETGRQSKRQRLLPATSVVYLSILLALHAEASIREVLRMLLQGLRDRLGRDRIEVAGGTAITFARRRLGVEPLAWLFDRVAVPAGGAEQPGCRWRGWRPMAVDGTVVDVQCTEANTKRFGQFGNQHGKGGFPQVRVVALLECATRAPVGFAHGEGRANEGRLADRMVDRLRPDMLVLADRGFHSFARWRDWSKRCGALVWRVARDLRLKPDRVLPDGSFLARIRPSRDLCRQGLAEPGEEMTVRVVRYRAVMEDGSRGEDVTLITTILDPAVADAEEIAGLYPTRWAVETGFDELKTHLRGPGRILRGQLPELVEQELHGFFLAYYVVRATMAEAARRGGIPPDRLSFVHAVRVIRRRTAIFPSAPNVGESLPRDTRRDRRGDRPPQDRKEEPEMPEAQEAPPSPGDAGGVEKAPGIPAPGND
jgi:hypothetical protein